MNLPRNYSNTHCSSAARSSLSALSALVASLKAARKHFSLAPSLPSSLIHSLSSIPCSQHTKCSVCSSTGIRQHHQPEKRIVFFIGVLFIQQAGRHGHCRQKRGRAVLSDGVSFVLSMVAVTMVVMFPCSSHGGVLFAKRGLIDGRTQH